MPPTEHSTPPSGHSRDPEGAISIGPLTPEAVEAADRVMRVAFGTFLGAPDPITVFGDMDHVRSRYAADPGRAFAAELDGEVVGSIFATRWGSYGSFGPLTVRPDLWDRGIAGRLMEPVMDLFGTWSVRQAGLFTFAQSPKHVDLYHGFGFWPQHLTALMGKALAEAPASEDYTTYSQVEEADRAGVLAECHSVTDSVFEGLDASGEIHATDTLGLGDTLLLREDSGVVGFAVCHCGAGEAGSGACFIKFGAVRAGPRGGRSLRPAARGVRGSGRRSRRPRALGGR